MCGIFGMILNKPATHEETSIFRGLMYSNETRGRDSTGVYTNRGNMIYKRACSAGEFIADFDFDKLLGSTILLGHTRLPTTGKVSDKNAHPFQFGKTISVHNGVLFNQYKFKDELRFEVDSEIITYLLAKHKNDPRKAFPEMSGYFSIAWTRSGHDLYLVRHNNPLYIAFGRGSLFFSSEEKHLESALMTVYGRVDYIEQIPEDMMYKVTQDIDFHLAPVKFLSYESSYGGSFGSDWDMDNIFPKTTFDIHKDYTGEYDPYPTDDEVDYLLYCDAFDKIMAGEGCSVCKGKTPDGYVEANEAVVFCSTCGGRLRNLETKDFKLIQILAPDTKPQKLLTNGK